jgi:hypothetical protein
VPHDIDPSTGRKSPGAPEDRPRAIGGAHRADLGIEPPEALAEQAEATEDDAQEYADGAEDTSGAADGELDLETPEGDAAEQRLDLLQRRDVPITERPDDADDADAAEQHRVVALDEDDYR